MVWFIFEQKTAYELRISDGSSDVCSSDLRLGFGRSVHVRRAAEPQPRLQNRDASQARIPCPGCNNFKSPALTQLGAFVSVDSQRSAERRVGEASVSTCRSRWSPDH